MSKFRGRDRTETGETLSEGRVEYLEAARARVRRRRLRWMAVAVVVLTLVVAAATGFWGSSISRLKDVVDTAGILLSPSAGYPQQTGIPELLAARKLDGSYVLLGEDSCVVYSTSGNRLNSVQSGYARPALAAGRTRFVVYNRSGNELRVESRTQNLYTKTMENSIHLCAMADGGQLAVVTDNTDSMARLLVYSAEMKQLLSWNMTSAEGIPLRMEFAADSRSLAMATVTAKAGQLVANVYVLDLAQGDPVCLGSADSAPQWLGWLAADRLMVVFGDKAVLYDAAGGERAVYRFDGSELVSVSADENGAALLLKNGQICTAVVLDKYFTEQYSGNVLSANSIVRDGGRFYLLTDDTVECFDTAGEHQWTQTFSVRPQAMLTGKQNLVFCGNTVQVLSEPETAEETQH